MKMGIGHDRCPFCLERQRYMKTPESIKIGQRWAVIGANQIIVEVIRPSTYQVEVLILSPGYCGNYKFIVGIRPAFDAERFALDPIDGWKNIRFELLEGQDKP